MGNVTKIREVSREAEVNQDVVRILENTLKLAKEGEFDGIALAASRRNGGTHTHFSRSTNMTALVAGVSALQYDMLRSWADEGQ